MISLHISAVFDKIETVEIFYVRMCFLMDKLKVAAYCRVSTEKDDQVNSLSSQIKYFTEYISNHPDWQMAEVYYDEGITGTKNVSGLTA